MCSGVRKSSASRREGPELTPAAPRCCGQWRWLSHAGIRRSVPCILSGIWLALAACGGESGSAPAGDMASGTGDGACPRDLPSRDACLDGAPTYVRDTAAIVERRCATCHYPDNPFSEAVLVEYEALLARRQTLLSRIYACVMPPEGAPALSASERAALLEWLVCGAAEE